MLYHIALKQRKNKGNTGQILAKSTAQALQVDYRKLRY